MSGTSSFKNIIVHQKNAEGEIVSVDSNVNDLLMSEKNRFEGWECWAGIQNITIDNEGDVWRAICKQGDKLGSIHTEFTIPTDTVICAKLSCNCAADIQLSKAHPNYKHLLRISKNERQ